MKKATKEEKVIDACMAEGIDVVYRASSKKFAMSFQMGGWLTITVDGGKLVYNLFDVNGDAVK